MQCGGPYWLPPHRAPFGRRAGEPSKGAPTGTARSPRARKRECPHLPLLGEECTTPGLSKNPTLSLAIFSTLGDAPRWLTSGTKLRIVAAEAGGGVCGQTGTDRFGWYACPWRTLFATEWSAVRQNPLRAVALHLRAAISADIKACRILPSGRRKFPSGNFRSARDLEGAERVNPRKARLRPSPHLLQQMRNVPIPQTAHCGNAQLTACRYPVY